MLLFPRVALLSDSAAEGRGRTSVQGKLFECLGPFITCSVSQHWGSILSDPNIGGGQWNKLSTVPCLSTVLSFLWTLCADLPLWAGLDTVHRAAMAGAEVGPVGTRACWSMSVSAETQENHTAHLSVALGRNVNLTL